MTEGGGTGGHDDDDRGLENDNEDGEEDEEMESDGGPEFQYFIVNDVLEQMEMLLEQS